MNFEPIQIDLTVNKRQSKWVMVCPYCQWERIITYCQAWNIQKRKCRKECNKCQIELGLKIINKKGLELGRNKINQEKSRLSRIGIKKKNSDKIMIYNNLFHGHPSKKEEVKEKFRKAKLGKIRKNNNISIFKRINTLKRNNEKRRKLLKIATPKWLSKIDLQTIKCIYRLAKAFTKYTGTKYEVDHIIPINNDKVCGLHVPCNLRIIEAYKNRVKKNKLMEI